MKELVNVTYESCGDVVKLNELRWKALRLIKVIRNNENSIENILHEQTELEKVRDQINALRISGEGGSFESIGKLKKLITHTLDDKKGQK